eukprot:Sspe_Gene.118376::Locus_111666_Transcript_3_4_Confidence_0.400_Length_625::g.118376::m.118376
MAATKQQQSIEHLIDALQPTSSVHCRENERRHKPIQYGSEDIPTTDLSVVVGLLAGVAWLFLRPSKALAWLAFFATLSSIASIKSSEIDLRLLLVSSTFGVMSVIMTYYVAWTAMESAVPEESLSG